MEQLFTTANLVQAGAVVISLVLIWAIYKITTIFTKAVTNHIAHNSEILGKLAEAIDNLIHYLKSNSK